MKTPEWLAPALYGAAAGAVALAIVGFSWGGWVTGATAQKMAGEASASAVAASWTPYCVARSKDDPNSSGTLAELKAANGFNRLKILESAGWATPLGADEPNRALARACDQALAEG
ncbi:MAG: hypothetical protein K5872_04675 [Rhizobiaceae bacterium]|nr:hypothetical protein [Rhizobiaceae bacterium]MCV0405504.1 hypothetical protein [Rhizobiaceae bacterium]